jgi:hypothetical protein
VSVLGCSRVSKHGFELCEKVLDISIREVGLRVCHFGSFSFCTHLAINIHVLASSVVMLEVAVETRIFGMTRFGGGVLYRAGVGFILGSL